MTARKGSMLHAGKKRGGMILHASGEMSRDCMPYNSARSAATWLQIRLKLSVSSQSSGSAEWVVEEKLSVHETSLALSFWKLSSWGLVTRAASVPLLSSGFSLGDVIAHSILLNYKHPFPLGASWGMDIKYHQ